jgi:hypothetical protein
MKKLTRLFSKRNLAEKRTINRCFFCGEEYFPGHYDICLVLSTMKTNLGNDWQNAFLKHVPALLKHISFKPGKYFCYYSGGSFADFFGMGTPFIIDATNHSYSHNCITEKYIYDFDKVWVTIFYDFREDNAFFVVSQK